MKAYFVIPEFFYNATVGKRQYLELVKLSVGGISTLTSKFFAQRSFKGVENLSDPFTSYHMGYCSKDMSSCSYDSVNSFNPFYNDWGLDFSFSSGKLARGQATGTLTGDDYGTDILNVGVDKQIISSGEGLVMGSFFIDVDDTKDLYMEMKLYTEDSGEVFFRSIVIAYYAKTGQFEYYSKSSNYKTYGDGFLGRGIGWLNGEDTGEFKLSQLKSALFGIRSRSYALRVSIPLQEPVVTSDECCYHNVIFADDTGVDYQNDYTSFFHKRQTPIDTCDFKLIRNSDLSEYDLNSSTYGEFFDFNDNDIIAYRVDWSKVLNLLGEGIYQVKKELTTAGISTTIEYSNYDLRTYSTQAAYNYIRLDCVMNGYLEKHDADFKGMNLESSLRMKGFFGRREPGYEIDNVVYNDNVSRQISLVQNNEYQFQSLLIPHCITMDLFDYFLMADTLTVNDYNPKNHSLYIKKPVELKDNKGTKYYSHSSMAIVNLAFSDRVKDSNKRHR